MGLTKTIFAMCNGCDVSKTIYSDINANIDLPSGWAMVQVIHKIEHDCKGIKCGRCKIVSGDFILCDKCYVSLSLRIKKEFPSLEYSHGIFNG